MGIWRDGGGRVAGFTVAGLLAVVGLVWVGVAAWGADRMPRDAEVEGVDLGGLSRAEADARLEDELAGPAERPVQVTYGDGRGVDVVPSEAGLSVDVEASLDEASGGARFSPSRVIALVGGGGDHEAAVAVDGEAMTATIDELTDGLARPVREGGVEFRDGEAVAVPGRAGRVVDPERAEALLVDRFLEGGSRKLPIVTEEPTVSAEAVRTAMSEVAEPAVSRPVRLVMAGKRLVVEPEVFSRALSMEAVDGELELRVDGEAFVEALEPRLAQIGTAPVDAGFTVRDGRPRVTPSEPGRELDAAEVQEGLATAVLAAPGERRLEVQGREAEPDLTTEEAKALGVKRRVSTFTTYFPYAEYRNVNIGRAAELVDGTLLMPDDVFSLNGIVGERTAENGFTEGYIIADGIFRNELGGGVSQMATTTFNAMFFAGLEDVEHKPHSVYIDRYPEGREATVAWPTLDLRFRNNTEHGVYITASLSPASYAAQGAVTVSMYSTKEWDVEARKSARYAYTSPSTRYLTDADCEAATGTSGFSVDVWRDFRRPGSQEVAKTEEFKTVYIPGDTVVCGPPPGSEPEPRPERPRRGGTTGGGGGDNDRDAADGRGGDA